jgi:gas vesicle protein
MSDSKEALSNGLLFFLLGAAVGAVVVALVTPKSGPDLRADLKDMGNRVKDKAMRVGSELRAGAQEVAGNAMDEASS